MFGGGARTIIIIIIVIIVIIIITTLYIYIYKKFIRYYIYIYIYTYKCIYIYIYTHTCINGSEARGQKTNDMIKLLWNTQLNKLIQQIKQFEQVNCTFKQFKQIH